MPSCEGVPLIQTASLPGLEPLQARSVLFLFSLRAAVRRLCSIL